MYITNHIYYIINTMNVVTSPFVRFFFSPYPFLTERVKVES